MWVFKRTSFGIDMDDTLKIIKNLFRTCLNMDEKADNLDRIAKSLDLNLDSFVFWDDNPLERDKMRTLLPQVSTIEVPKDVWEWPSKLRKLDSLAKTILTDDDKRKSEQYKARANFSDNLNDELDLNHYLSTLNLKPELIDLNSSNISRAEQMCLKTNQFNLSTKRHSATDLLAINAEEKGDVFLVKLKDFLV